MKIEVAGHEILTITTLDGDSILRLLELAGRTCYKSEDRITEGSVRNFVKKILDSGHHSVIEHASLTVRFTCDRGVSHELVRHRLASYSQESTRYCNYAQGKFGNEITVIAPCFWQDPDSVEEYEAWHKAMEMAETAYMVLMEYGEAPQQARSVLPNSLKTEIVMTCNIREWRHVLSLRCHRTAHPQMREIMLPLLRELNERVPVLFEDLYEEFAVEMEGLAQQERVCEVETEEEGRANHNPDV